MAKQKYYGTTNKKSRLLSFRIPHDLADQLQWISLTTDTPMNAVVIAAVRSYLANNLEYAETLRRFRERAFRAPGQLIIDDILDEEGGNGN